MNYECIKHNGSLINFVFVMVGMIAILVLFLSTDKIFESYKVAILMGMTFVLGAGAHKSYLDYKEQKADAK